MHLYYYLALYLITFILFSIVYMVLKKHKKRLLGILVYGIETMNYDFISTTFNSKDKIFDYQKTIEILFDGKEKFIKWKHYKVKDFYAYYQDLQTNMDYLEELLDKKVFNNSFSQLQNAFNLVFRLNKVYNFVVVVLSVLSLWLFSLFFKDRNYC